jgi:hypothetical protein
MGAIPPVDSLDIVYEARFGTGKWITNPNDFATFARRYRRILVVDARSWLTTLAAASPRVRLTADRVSCIS